MLIENKKINENLLYKELSYRLVGCFYDVYNELGPAHKEQIYHEALIVAFGEENIGYESRKRISIKYKGKHVGIYEPDFVIEEKIIIELKSVLNMPKVFENQLYYYLKGSAYKLGYIINFGNEHIDIRRRIFEDARLKQSSRSRS